MHLLISVFLTCIVLLVLAQPVVGFGAGDIPDFAYLNDKAFRHGDIESILSTLAKNVGGAAASGGLMSIAASVLSAASGSGGAKFNKMDVKRVYFGNWLRDYSQAMDIAGLSKLTAQTLVTVVSVLGFMTFGFATAEFEVTAERLGVYLPIEHIDNPKGYAEKEGDARQFHPKLRPPVDPRELEVNPRNGMKNYIATEGQSWDTSSAHVRRVLQQCIAHGRRARGEENDDQWEAFRLLGTGLHTLEDLLAHSNWCELALRKMGHKEVFCHVGDQVVINTPHGPAPPLVTGTFGSADFMHSVLGEGMDHLSEASVSNLAGKMDEAKSQGDGPISTLKSLLSKLPSSGGSSNEEKVEQAEDIKNKAYDFNPDDVAPEDLQKQMWQVLEWRDSVYRDILKKIEMVPGLSELVDELIDALNAYVFTVLEPVMKPMLQQATGVLQDGSKAVIDTDDQYEVFNDPRASDPSHSILAKDHFGLILNEPAGRISQVVVEYSVNLIVKAWYDEHEDANRVIDKILESFHHPYFANGNSEIQRKMTDRLEQWINGLGHEDAQKTLQALTKQSVREGKNKRPGDDNAEGETTQDDRVGPDGGLYVGSGQERTQYSGKVFERSQNNENHYGDNQYSSTGSTGGRRTEGHGTHYTPQPSAQPSYARYDGGQHRHESDRHGHGQSNEYSSNDQPGEGRHRSRDQYVATEGLGGRRAELASNSGRGGYGEDTPTQTSYGQRESYATPTQTGESATGFRAGYGQTQESHSEDRQHHKHRQHQAETRTTDYSETSSYEEQSYGQPARSVHSAHSYSSGGGGGGGAGDDEYGSRQTTHRQQPHHVSGSAMYGSHESSTGRGGRDVYGTREETYGQQSQRAHVPAASAVYERYDTSSGRGGGDVYSAREETYGQEPQRAPASAVYERYDTSEGRGGSSYGGETQSYGAASSGRHHGHNEDASYDTAGNYTRGDAYEGGGGGGYGTQTRPDAAYGRQEGYGQEASETFGAETLTLEENQGSYRGEGYVPTRKERDYF